MKLKYFIPSLMAVVAAMFTGCSDNNDPTYLDEIRVSKSLLAIHTNGGSETIDIEAKGSWAVSNKPDWLTVSPASGTGNGQITFSAAAGVGRSAELFITCEGKVQNISITQGVTEVSNATCADVIAGPDSKTYRVTGVVTGIANTIYGNWYLNDGTGEIYIYGTLDRKGAEKNFQSLGIEVGDEVTIEGPKTTYNGTVELVNVTVITINKSLIKCDSLSTADPLPLEGGEVTAYLTCKGSGVAVEIPEDAKDWLGVVNSTVGSNPTVTFRAAPNAGGDRNTTVTFKTTNGSRDFTSQVTISQKGAIIECSVADFLAAPVGDIQYRLTGVISGLYTSDKQGKSFYIQDYSGKTLVYRIEGFIESGAKVGDVVTVVGKRGAYKDSPQMVNGTFEKLNYPVSALSIADFRNLPDNKEAYYMISGVISKATEDGTKNDVAKYGNFNLTDETGSIYIYGVTNGWNGPKGEFGAFGLDFGDKLTIIAYKTTYKGLVQGVGTYFSSEKAK
jgi:RPA family protein